MPPKISLFRWKERERGWDGTRGNCDLLYLVLYRLTQIVTIALNWFCNYSRSGNHYYFNNICLFGGYRNSRVCISGHFGPHSLYFNHSFLSTSVFYLYYLIAKNVGATPKMTQFYTTSHRIVTHNYYCYYYQVFNNT